MALKRYWELYVAEDLARKMAFIGGPRQVGKTTLAKRIAESFSSPAYFNWDSRSHRASILAEQWPPETDLLIFDELHKYAKWKSLIKGIWDTRRFEERVIVTGSSRLDIFRRGGDSLMGRYHYYCLHPFSLREVDSPRAHDAEFPDAPPLLDFGAIGKSVEALFEFGGFPEPFIAGSKRTLKRWQKERFERVFREDIRDVEPIRSLSQLELLAYMLPSRVGSPLSMSALSEDIEASPKTVQRWMDLICRNYYAFRVPPYHRRLERALKKESKYYLWDWSEIEDRGARFENMIAAHLLKFCHFYRDGFGIGVELYYLRDLEKREVDFLVVWEREPWFLVECKLTAASEFTHIEYFARRLRIPHKYLVTLSSDRDYADKRTAVRVIPAAGFLMALT